MDKILVLDTTLRDGEQSPGFSMTSDQKIEFARQLQRLNVDIIEAGFPAASPDDFAAVQKIAREVKGPIITGLARCVPGDIDTLWEAVKVAETPRIHTFLSTSDIHLSRQFRLTREQAKERAVEMVQRAKSYCSDVEFSPMDATRTEWPYLYEVIEAVINAGATTINIADTCGYSLPDEFEQMLRGIWEHVSNAHKAVISVHCHNDLGLATANALTAVRVGARQVEVCVNGIGERAGNTALEEFVMALNVRKDWVGDLGTTINTREIFPASQMLTEFTGEPVQANKPIVGRNSFAHESGIHQDGVLKDKITYEIMKPEEVGRHDDRLVLGKHSGRHALRVELAKLGYEMGSYDLLDAFRVFKNVADTKKEVFAEDLHGIMRSLAVPVVAR
ncbi:MAG: 2-isopropylmalate synthase [Chloroflexota bacterium]